MANNVKDRAYPIKLDKQRNLKFDMNAFIELEEKFGSLDKVFETFKEGQLNFKVIRTMLWAGLLHEDENLTEKQAGSFIGLDNMQHVAETITKALSGALPQAKN